MANPQQVGSFVPTTNIWAKAQQLQNAEMGSPEFRNLLVSLYQDVGLIAQVLNTKDSALYNQSEFVNGQVWFSNPALNSASQLTPVMRQVFRKVINFGPLPNATTISMPHGITITSSVTFTRIYGAASDTVGFNYIPIPYVEASGAIVSISVDATNVNITTVDDRTNYTVSYVILEFLKF